MSLSPAPYPNLPEVYVCQNNTNVGSYTPPLHDRQSICLGNPFAPLGGAREWNTNDLLIKDECLRKMAYVAPLDCDITALYYVNGKEKI